MEFCEIVRHHAISQNSLLSLVTELACYIQFASF
jgi:hypothetical protein